MDPQHPRHRRPARRHPEQRAKPGAAARQPPRRHRRHRLPLRNSNRTAIQDRYPPSTAYRPPAPGEILVARRQQLPTELPAASHDGCPLLRPSDRPLPAAGPSTGGSANAYAYTFGDPVNTSDPSGAYTVATPAWLRPTREERARWPKKKARRLRSRRSRSRRGREAAAKAAKADAPTPTEGGAGATGRLRGVGRRIRARDGPRRTRDSKRKPKDGYS